MTPGKWHSKFIPLPQLTLQMIKPSNTIVNDNKQLLNCIIIYYHNNIAIIYDISNLQKKISAKKKWRCRDSNSGRGSVPL